MKNASVLIAPACEKGRGGGHLIRSLLILQALKANGRDAFLWVPDCLKDDFLHRFSDFFNFLDSPCLLSREEELKGRTWDFIVFDRFKTSKKEFKFFSSFAPVIGIDEGGPFRDRFDFLIDLLPSLEKTAPNIFSPALLSLPRNRRPDIAGEKASAFRVLISFGAEDLAGLGIAAARSLSDFLANAPTEKQLEVTLVSPIPPHNSQWEIEELFGITVFGRIPHLSERLAEYDLFITHFGLGAFEAVYARLPVILVSPGMYHEKLSRKAGFFSLGIDVAAASRLGNLIHNIGNRTEGHRTEGSIKKPDLLKTLERKSREIADRYGLWEDQKETIASFLCRVSPRSPLACPICKKPRSVPVLERFPEESYRQCPCCGIIYLARLKEPSIEYEKDYFFSDYKKQYGKTYLEDFPSLVETGKRRLGHIESLLNLHEEKPSILDIGCAYGPFLAAAAECGFSPTGVEPAPDAARYVKEELGFPCYQGFFPAAIGGLSGFDAVTLWYVIEHFDEVGETLRVIHGLLKKGGALAFSTPSFSGISGKKSLSSFLKNSPSDHFTVWSPRICAWILRRYGFKLRKIVVTGHHPERFPLLGRFADPAKKGLLYRILLFISRLFRLGDTFEVYALKE